MKKLLLPLLSCLAIFDVANGQIPKSEVKGNKIITTVDRKTLPFSHIKVIGLHATLEKGNQETIRIQAESNIVKYVQSSVVGDTLIIQPDMSIPLRDIHSPVVHISFKNIKSILGSVAEIKLLSPIESDSLVLKLQTASRVEGEIYSKFLDLKLLTSQAVLSGTALEAKMSLITKSNLEGKDLKIQNLTLWTETLSKADLNVSQEITASILGDNEISNAGAAIAVVKQAPIDKMFVPKFTNGRPDIYKFEK
ncbi:GIN domain-containing protein [Dyadobacter sp. CY312]|uniref:GIN domain-containing protein n=1 Tax=Dyadobacter sp. CY312 TaxID=2907303 RepID=UPI001F2D0B32|nr:DUF2807 domain-containing protein [Dyadobacter sp. CY312]MCE7040608.1 DUF2807 domain-containing protein [Dyadobacter sp. CY312]